MSQLSDGPPDYNNGAACQTRTAPATIINISTNISLSSGCSLNVIGIACRISLPPNVSTTRTAAALSQLPVDLHGELVKTLQKRLSTVNVAAAPFSTLPATWTWGGAEDSLSAGVLGSLADWFHQSAAMAPNITVSSVPNSRTEASAASGVRANSTSSHPSVPIPSAVAPPTMRSQIRPDFGCM
jgi:hypothetical protein